MHATSVGTESAGYRSPAPGEPSALGPVLIAVDGDETPTVMRTGALLSRHLARGAVVVSAIDPLRQYGWHPGSGARGAGATEALVEQRREQLRRELEVAGGSAAWPLAIELGGAPRVIARVAREVDASVLVMGLGRHRPVDRLLGGETVLRTLRDASCPVLAVPQGFGHLPRVVVVGVDFSRGSTDALRAVLPLLAPDATVHLLHVCHAVDLADADAVSADVQYRTQLPSRFRRLMMQAGVPEQLDVRIDVLEGRPSAQLLAAADSRNADLVVVGRHGEGWLDRLIVGRVTERVLRATTSAVLVVPEAGPSGQEPLPTLQGIAGVDHPRPAWPELLERFTRDNAGRLTVFESCDRDEGLCSREAGYLLFGMTYRAPEHEIEIILGESNGRRRHLTRVIPDARALATFADEHGDRALRIEHGRGLSVLSVIR